jgi:LmbE family N-acetylglucosaminyl deacetylase
VNILSISVHPDDETLGCGGTLLKHHAAGDTLHWLIITSVSQPNFTAEVVDQQARQVEAVREAYPFASLNWLKLPTTRLESMPLNDIIDPIREVVMSCRPHIVYVPNRSDAHSDHRVVADAAHAVLKSFHLRSMGVQRVLACEVISETDAAPALPENSFLPNVFIDVSNTLERKLEIMQMYKSETQAEFLPRHSSSIRALARLRGATIAVEYAESFMLVRELL